MTSKLSTILAATALLGGLATATAAFADSTTPSTQPPTARGATADNGGMADMKGQMSADHMKQMTAMIDNCNSMMASMGRAPSHPDKEETPEHHG